MTLGLVHKQIVFRVDALIEVGKEHVMCCLALAADLTEHGAQMRFICRAHDGNPIALIKHLGFTVHTLSEVFGSAPSNCITSLPVHADWLGGSWQTDVEQCLTLISDPVY